MASKDAVQLVTYPFAGGVDERTQPELVDPLRNCLRLENVRANQRVQEAYLGSAVADAQGAGH